MKELLLGIKKWYLASFKTITTEQALELDLEFHRNVYGDEINFLWCRSIWTDGKYYFRVWELNKDEH